MPLNLSPRTACRGYERPWREYCVDANLADEWLERLNDLQAFQLISICEGHHDRGESAAGRYPHLNLRLKEHLLPGIASRWDELRAAMLNEVHSRFLGGDTHLNLELKFKLRTGRGRLVYQEDFTLKLRCNQARISADIDAGTRHWFETTVERLEALDQAVLAWHQPASPA